MINIKTKLDLTIERNFKLQEQAELEFENGKELKTNIIYNQSSEILNEPDCSVDLIVTSPPYNVNIKYDNYNDNINFIKYKQYIIKIFTECYRVLKIGGRICINIANTYINSYIPMNSVYDNILSEIGFILRDEIIWFKNYVNCNSTAWGSFKSPSNPILRTNHEYIIVAYKIEPKLQYKGISDLTNEEFKEYTKNEWVIQPSRNNLHPATFPEELPKRCIKLYSWIDAIILDPFCGSGTTCMIAKMLNRKYIGYDISKKYCNIAQNRINSASKQSFESKDISKQVKKLTKLGEY